MALPPTMVRITTNHLLNSSSLLKNAGISEKGDTIIGEKHNEDLSTPADFGSPARLDGEKITSEKPMPTNGSMGQEKETALGSDNEAKNNFVLRPAKLVLKST